MLLSLALWSRLAIIGPRAGDYIISSCTVRRPDGRRRRSVSVVALRTRRQVIPILQPTCSRPFADHSFVRPSDRSTDRLPFPSLRGCRGWPTLDPARLSLARSRRRSYARRRIARHYIVRGRGVVKHARTLSFTRCTADLDPMRCVGQRVDPPFSSIPQPPRRRCNHRIDVHTTHGGIVTVPPTRFLSASACACCFASPATRWYSVHVRHVTFAENRTRLKKPEGRSSPPRRELEACGRDLDKYKNLSSSLSFFF